MRDHLTNRELPRRERFLTPAKKINTNPAFTPNTFGAEKLNLSGFSRFLRVYWACEQYLTVRITALRRVHLRELTKGIICQKKIVLRSVWHMLGLDVFGVGRGNSQKNVVFRR